MSIISDDGLLAGKCGLWFSDDHIVDSWFNRLAAYNPFASKAMVFSEQHLLKGLPNKIAFAEYRGENLSDFYFYNQALAKELIIYLPEYTEVSGNIYLDHQAKIRFIAPKGLSISGADFQALDVMVSTHNLSELENILYNRDSEEEIRAESTSTIEISKVKGSSLWLEACEAVIGGDNTIVDFRAVLYCTKPIDDYSFKILNLAMLSSSIIIIEDLTSSKGVSVEGDILASIVSIDSNNNFFLEGEMKVNQAKIDGNYVHIGDFGSIKLASYLRPDGTISAPGSLIISGDKGLFAPSSRIYYALNEVIEHLELVQEAAAKVNASRDYRDYSCYSGGICLSNDIGWLFGDDREFLAGNATSSMLKNDKVMTIDQASSLALISLLFTEKLKLSGSVSGESGVNIIAEVINLLEGGKLDSKNGAIKLCGDKVNLAGEIRGDYLELEAKDLKLNSDKISLANINIYSINLQNLKNLKAGEICITLEGKLENEVSGVIESRAGSITALELINRGIIRLNYGSFLVEKKLDNQGEISNLTHDKESTLEFLSNSGSLTSRGIITANKQIKFESREGEIIVDSIVVEQGNIYLFGKKVISKDLKAKGIEVKSKDWQAKNVKSEVISFTNESQDEKAIFTGKIEAKELLVTSGTLNFSENSEISIGEAILNIRDNFENKSPKENNQIEIFAQNGGYFSNNGFLTVKKDLSIETNNGSFSNSGYLAVKNQLEVKAKKFEMGKSASDNYQLIISNGIIELDETFNNFGKIIASQSLKILAGGELASYNLIESKQGNLYLKSGSNIYSFDGVINNYSEILAEKGQVTLEADGRIHIYIIKAKNVYLKTKIEYTHGVLVKTEEDFELHVPYYYNPHGGKIEVGGIWHLIEEDPIGEPDLAAKQLSFHYLNKAATVGKGLHFVGREWAQYSDFELSGNLILNLTGNFINYNKLIIHGNLQIESKGSASNDGYMKIDGGAVITAKNFYNKKLWHPIASDLSRTHNQLMAVHVHGETETMLQNTLSAINHYRKTHSIETYSKIDIGKDVTGELYADKIFITVEGELENAAAGIIRANNGMELTGNYVSNLVYHRRTGVGAYGDASEFIPSIIESLNGDINIHANDRIYVKGADVIARNGKIYEYARYNIVHELVSAGYMVRSADLIYCKNNFLYHSDGRPVLINAIITFVHSSCSHMPTKELLTFAPYYFSRPTNVYAKEEFYAYSEQGTVSAIGAQIASHGEVILSGKDVTQKPVLVGNEWVGGVTMGHTVSFDAKENLYLSGGVITKENMYLEAGKAAHIESLQHAYIKRYAWSKKYKHIIYDFVISEVQLIAGGAVSVKCGEICHLKGAIINSQEDVVIKSPKVLIETAYEQRLNFLYQKKKKLFGSTKIDSRWSASSSIPTTIHSAKGKVTIEGDHTKTIGLKLDAPNVEITGKKSLDISEFTYKEIREIRTKSKGLGAPKPDKELLQNMMGSSYMPIKSPKMIGFSSWILDSVKNAKAETVTDLEGPLGLSTDVLRAKDIYTAYKDNGATQNAALAKAMLSMLPSLNFNLGTVKTYVKMEKEHVVPSKITGQHVNIKSGGDATISSASLTAEKEVNIDVKGKLEVKAAAEKVTQEGRMTSHGPMVSANFNGVTVAFAHSESDYTAVSSHHIPSLITAPKVIVEVGENLSIRGAYIKGEKVDIKVAKDLLIESLKDVNTMASSSSSISLGVSFGRHGIAPAVSFAIGESSQNSELVNFISGIGGGDVSVVAEKIHLKGSELYGMEKLKVIGEVSNEDIEEINESSSAHFGMSFDPTKATGGGNPLTSVNFGISEKHDNGVVHSGLGQQASHESTSKGGYTVSGQWNNVLQGNAEKVIDWFKNPANDYTPAKISNYFATQADSEQLHSEYAEMRKSGLSEEEALYAVKAMNNLKDEPQTSSGAKRIEVTQHNRVSSESTTIASDYYGGWENIPETVHDRIIDGDRAYIENGELKFDSEEMAHSKVPHHEKLVNLAYKADRVIRVVGELLQKYGTATDVALTAINAAFAGTVAAVRGIVQSAVADELVGEYIKEGAVYVLEKGAKGVQKADPYLSNEHAKSLVLAFGGVLGAIFVGKEVKDIFHNVHIHPTHKLPDAEDIKHKHADLEKGDVDFHYPESVQSNIALKKQVASEQQMNEVGIVIAGGTSENQFRNSGVTAAKYGGNPEDYVKKSSSSFKVSDFEMIETHWIENTKTGERYEFKSIILKKRNYNGQ